MTSQPSCVAESTILRLSNGELTEAERSEALAHFDACSTCREALAQLVRASRTARPPQREDDAVWSLSAGALLGRGTTLERYVIVSHLGSGGMGVVYAAYDPELDRKVAIKLLRSQGDHEEADGEARARMLQEARAMARLSHPNVVAVYDVGLFGEQVFIAMESIEGITLRQWLGAGPGHRQWREIVDLFVQAGRGLEAAHAAGIVHRDFKPENVLVGRDGRARVTDFGLARVAPAAQADGPTSPEAESKALLGTPAYMAPEQRRGDSTDARSDIFSFCLSLYEALVGSRPEAGIDAKTVRSRLSRNHRGLRLAGRPSSWLAGVLSKGLSPVPDDRFASMTALLAALTAGQHRGRRRTTVAAALVLLLASGAGAAYLVARPAPCASARVALAGVWDEGQQQAIHDAFAATRLPYAEAAWLTVNRVLTSYADRWVLARSQACEATRVRHEQSEHAMALRLACLDQRFDELRAATTVLRRPDVEVVKNAGALAQGLRAVGACAGPAVLAMTLPADEAQRRTAVAASAKSALAQTQLRVGRFQEAFAAATEAAALVAALPAAHGDASLRAEVEFALAKSQQRVGRLTESLASFERAIAAADRARNDELRADIWIDFMALLGGEKQDRERLASLLPWAEAALARLDGDPVRDSAWAYVRGVMLFNQGELEAAATQLLRGVEAARAVPEGEVRLIALENTLGAVLTRTGRWADAAEHLEAAFTAASTLWGDTHPNLISILNELALLHSRQNHDQEALGYQRRALVLAEQAMGPEHPWTAAILVNLASMDKHASSEEKASYVERARAIYEKTFGPEHPKVIITRGNQGCLLAETGAFAEARAALEATIAVASRVLPPDHELHAHLLRCLGQAELGLGRTRAATDAYSRALRIVESATEDASRSAALRFDLAKALWKSGDATQARRYADAAHTAFATAGPTFAAEAAETAAWLADHGLEGSRR